MKFSSTRGGVTGISFEEALLMGFATDRGMLLPDTIPQVALPKLKQLSTQSFEEIVTFVLSLYATDIPLQDLKDLIHGCFHEFRHPDRVTMHDLGPTSFVAELWQGPTLTFKDFGLCVLSALVSYYLQRSGKRVNVIVATSGDTGPAAVHAIKNKPGVDIYCLSPINAISAVQSRQMTRVNASNVKVYSVTDGDSDSLDAVVSDLLFGSHTSVVGHVCSVNSPNMGRIIAQTAIYFVMYFKACQCAKVQVGARIRFCIPCGAGGNITAGIIASLMGLPIHSLVAAVNENANFSKFLTTGILYKGMKTIQTMSNAMDMQTAYNVERLMYLLTRNSPNFQDGPLKGKNIVKAIMEDFENPSSPHINVPRYMGQSNIQTLISEASIPPILSRSINDESTRLEMQRVWNQQRYMLDPHTAVGTRACYEMGLLSNPSLPCVIISTAHPFKFPESIQKCIGEMPQAPQKELESLLQPDEVSYDKKLALKECAVTIANDILERKKNLSSKL